jgi:hypothetical protein
METNARRGVTTFIVAVVLIGAVTAAFAEDPQPEIFIPVMKYDFGDMFEQESYEHTFVLENKGKADLVIEHVKPG